MLPPLHCGGFLFYRGKLVANRFGFVWVLDVYGLGAGNAGGGAQRKSEI